MNREEKLKRLEELQAQAGSMNEEILQLAEELQQENVAQPVAVAKFVLYTNGAVDIVVDWDKDIRNEEGLGFCIGSLIHSITAGKLNSNIHQALVAGSQQNITHQPIVEATIKEWSDLVKRTNGRLPVHPSQVFGVTKAQGGEYDDEIVSEDIE